MKSWETLLEGLKREFPHFEEKGIPGIIPRTGAHDLACKILNIKEGENKASEYARKFKANPVEGLKTNPELTEKVLFIAEMCRLKDKPIPVVSLQDLAQWLIMELQEKE